MSHPSASARFATPVARVDPSRRRLWVVLVPIHVLAFVGLYAGMLRFLENAYLRAGEEASRGRLDQAVREMPFFAPAPGQRSPHVFEHLLVAHAPIGLRLYDTAARPVGTPNLSTEPAEVHAVERYLAKGAAGGEVWMEHDRGRAFVHGLHLVVADAGCVPCHEAGRVLGVASMRMDFTRSFDAARASLRLQVAALAATWIFAVGAVTMLVQRTVRRSALRLEADLAAASAGGGLSPEPAGLPLDPVTAEIHRGLRRFLERQRQHDSEVVERLAHADQLASLGQLAAGLAHEVKNPLAGIQGALEVLRDEDPDSNVAPVYGEMLGELKRVNAILQRLLESARPAPLRLATTDTAKLLGEISELLTHSLRRQGVGLTVEAAADLPAVRLDPAKIRQILVNLIQNAAEAMKHGGRVAVRATRLASAGGVLLAVEDDGPGIPRADLARIFEPFYTTKFTGTGLGLAIARSLVEQHGGTLEVDSELGKGTTFFVVLPDRGSDRGGEPSGEAG